MGGRDWNQYVERRLYNVNPLWRLDTLFLCYLFDIKEKTVMHKLPSTCFLPDSVERRDGANYAALVAENSDLYESRC